VAIVPLLISLLLLGMPGQGADEVEGPVRNPGFESVSDDGAPTHWIVPGPGAFRASVVDDVSRSGDRALMIERLRAAGEPADGEEAAHAWTSVTQVIDAGPWRGKRIDYSAAVFVDSQRPGGRAQLWLRVDRPGGQAGFFDNMLDRPILDALWTRRHIVGRVADDAERIAFGVILRGDGRAWVDDVRLVEAEAPAPPSERGLANIEAFATLYGILRYFHPSTESQGFDWNAFAIHGARVVEPAEYEQALAAALRDLVAPIAPGVEVWVGEPDNAPAPKPLGAEPTHVVGMRHTGRGPDPGTMRPGYVYRSERIVEALSLDPDASRIAGRRTVIVRSLGGGVSARVPITLGVRDGATLPRAAAPDASHADLGVDQPPSIRDRATRLATVIVAWTAMQHFYPYFDLVDVDWPAQLRKALRAAAVDETTLDLLDTLRVMHATLRDGHGSVHHPGESAWTVPARARWIDDQLVVVATASDAPPTLAPGDVILRIDGEPVADRRAHAVARICASTPGFLDHQSAGDVLLSASPGIARLDVRKPDGAQLTIVAQRLHASRAREIREPRPADGAMLAPGIVYVDLNGLGYEDLLTHMPALKAADAIVFDLRGYPGSAGAELLNHITPEVIHSATWQIPVFLFPDQRNVEFETSRWTLTPKTPRLTAPIVFVTDGRAISYAESCMGIAEHYELGEIVGAPTAGTNGNVNVVVLPLNYRVAFTGMRVDKHDGSPLFGVGVLPTAPAAPTIAGIANGRDEVLEVAVELATRRAADSREDP